MKFTEKQLSEMKISLKEYCERRESSLKSKFDQADFKFIYENKVLTNSNNEYTDDAYISAPYKELFWTGIRVINANNSAIH